MRVRRSKFDDMTIGGGGGGRGRVGVRQRQTERARDRERQRQRETETETEKRKRIEREERQRERRLGSWGGSARLRLRRCWICSDGGIILRWIVKGVEGRTIRQTCSCLRPTSLLLIRQTVLSFFSLQKVQKEKCGCYTFTVKSSLFPEVLAPSTQTDRT
jgi:hypothetical protein